MPGKPVQRALGLILALLGPGASASEGFIKPAGPVATALRDHLVFIGGAMTIVIVPLPSSTAGVRGRCW